MCPRPQPARRVQPTIGSSTDATQADEAERLTVESLRSLPVHIWVGAAGDDNQECTLCMETFKSGDRLRTLPCLHHYHAKCIDRWLIDTQRGVPRSCPLCKSDPLQQQVELTRVVPIETTSVIAESDGLVEAEGTSAQHGGEGETGGLEASPT